MKTRRGLPPGVSEFRDRHGKWRVRGRGKRRRTLYFKSAPGTMEFEAEYRAWREGASSVQGHPSSAAPGTVSDLIERFYRSTTWHDYAESSKNSRRGVLERFREEHGHRLIGELRRKHIKAIIEKRATTPDAANFLLKMIHLLMRVAIEDELRDDDPTIGVRPFQRKGDGHHCWTDEEIVQFRTKFPLGTRPRLALELLLNTGQRLSDVYRMGKQHLQDGRIHVRQTKTRKHLAIPIHPDLAAALALSGNTNLTFVMTSFGSPYKSAKSFGNWFADRIDEAGLPVCCVTHGLRKASARRLAEVGCTTHEIASITGQSLQEVERYTRAANQVRMAEAAIHKLTGTDGEQKLANLSPKLANDHQD